MLAPMTDFAAASSGDGSIYVLGGQFSALVQTIFTGPGYNSSIAASRFDIAGNTWYPIRNMQTKRAGLSAVALGEFIYAIGGHGCDGAQCSVSNSVERYRLATNTWEYVAPMSIGRYFQVLASISWSLTMHMRRVPDRVALCPMILYRC